MKYKEYWIGGYMEKDWVDNEHDAKLAINLTPDWLVAYTIEYEAYDRLQKQNAIYKEALEFYQANMDYYGTARAREALTKAQELEKGD